MYLGDFEMMNGTKDSFTQLEFSEGMSSEGWLAAATVIKFYVSLSKADIPLLNTGHR